VTFLYRMLVAARTRLSGVTMEATGPLAGVRVLDLTSVVMGPLCTQMLGDLGADVVVVERLGGDANRVMGAGPHKELSGIALNLMRNKRSVDIDLRTLEGAAVVRDVIGTCDALVTTMLPASLARVGLTYPDVAAIRPDIVYAQAQGWPIGSDRANDPAYDDVVQAATGVADMMARLHGEPTLVPSIFADKVCGLILGQAVLAALLHRQRTGLGQHVEVPMVDAMRSFMLVEHGAAAIPEPPLGPVGYQRILTPERRPQRTADGWIGILPYAREHYEALFSQGDVTDLVDVAHYADARSRIAFADLLYRAVRRIVATRPTAYWLEFCSQNQVPASPIVSLDDIVAELPIVEHPVAGQYRHIPPAARFSRTPQRLLRPAPLIGEDTAEVIASTLELRP
jgi:crotonobetainyl-CoA:carnitine CoA-transferase CaiB-like acyl-CoA transferase